MERRVGLTLPTAAEQLQKTYPPAAGIQELPTTRADGSAVGPGRATANSVGIRPGVPLNFFVIGDSGGIKTAAPSYAVSNAMQQDVMRPGFVYHVGDEVYFNGAESEYESQFYECYAHLVAPVVGIPGNHDGTPDPAVTDLHASGIPTFIENFCAAAPGIPAADPQNEYGRDTMTQPYCDWTLADPALGVTIIGLWSNAPSGGHLFDSQTAFLTTELAAAATDRPLMVALHHPPYSIDAHHGGSAKMGAALDAAFEASKRCPDVVLSGHVHDYQRFTRSYWGRSITYVVIGNSGYHNLHKLAPGATEGKPLDAAGQVVYEFGDDTEWGYLKLSVEGMKISGEYVGVASTDDQGTPDVTRAKDTFMIGA